MDENHPIWRAIDRGGGQACDVAGVLRELDRAGYEIVSKDAEGPARALSKADNIAENARLRSVLDVLADSYGPVNVNFGPAPYKGD